MRIHSFGIALLSLPLAASVASAHISMTSPARRYADQKVGPCGKLGGLRTTNVTTFAPGQTITITWDETINHPGHYRVAFDADGHDDFVDPNSYTDTYTNAAVILDDIPDHAAGQGSQYSVQVTLPDVTCDNCTLQLVQVMTDKPPYTIGGNDLYYQCADLILVEGGAPPDAGPGAADAAPPGTPDAGPGGGGDDPEGGCTIAAGARGASADGAGSALALVLAGLVAVRRRRG